MQAANLPNPENFPLQSLPSMYRLVEDYEWVIEGSTHEDSTHSLQY